MSPFLFFSAIVNRLFGCSLPNEKSKSDCIGVIEVPDSYTGPRLKFPLTADSLHILIEAFKKQQVSRSRYYLDSCTYHVLNDYLLNA